MLEVVITVKGNDQIIELTPDQLKKIIFLVDDMIDVPVLREKSKWDAKKVTES